AEAESAISVDDAAQAVRESGAETVFFAVGADADRAFLDRLAAACGGRTVPVEDPTSLAGAVVGESGAIHRGGERHLLRPGELADLLRGEPPPTRARARCALRRGARAVYGAVEREPLLSYWRAGAGVAAAFCSTPGGEEAPGWGDAIEVWGPLFGLLS